MDGRIVEVDEGIIGVDWSNLKDWTNLGANSFFSRGGAGARRGVLGICLRLCGLAREPSSISGLFLPPDAGDAFFDFLLEAGDELAVGLH